MLFRSSFPGIPGQVARLAMGRAACATLARPNPLSRRYDLAALPRRPSAIRGAGKGLFLDEAVIAGSIVTTPDALDHTCRFADIAYQRALVRGPLHTVTGLAGRVLHQPRVHAERTVAPGFRVCVG